MAKVKKTAPAHWLKLLRVLVAALVLCSFIYAFLGNIPLLNPEGIMDTKGIAHYQFVPALLSATEGIALGVAILAVLLIITLLWGRIYCSWICPLGILQDIALRLRKWLMPKAKMLKYMVGLTWLRICFLCLCIGLAFLGLAGWMDPYSLFGRMAQTLARPVLSFANNLVAGDATSGSIYTLTQYPPSLWAILTILVFTLVLFVLSIWKGRIYCNTFCPVGTVLGAISKYSLFRLAFSPSQCTKCGQCQKSCKAQCLNLKNYTIDHSRCIACMNCVSACAERGIHYTWQGKPSPTKENKHAS